MKIKVIHHVCGRDILVSQVLDSQGHCPWDGKAFNNDYTAVLAEALASVEIAGGALENALEKVVGMEAAFTIDEESVLGHIRGLLERQNSARGAPRALNQARSRGGVI